MVPKERIANFQKACEEIEADWKKGRVQAIRLVGEDAAMALVVAHLRMREVSKPGEKLSIEKRVANLLRDEHLT